VRIFSQKIHFSLCLGALMAILFATLPVGALASDTKGYTVLEKTQATADASKVEVLVFFAYTCPHCYTLSSSFLRNWEVPEGADYHEMPLSYGSIDHLSRAYHTSEILGINKQFHPALFHAFLKERKPFKNKKALAKFATQFGVSEKQFLSMYDSFAVNVEMNRTDQLAKAYRIQSVPTVIINGKYMTSPSLAGGFDNLMAVMEQLIEQERATLKTSAPTTPAPSSQETD
jgi:thiol:disulfide interchange protein DsbA